MSVTLIVHWSHKTGICTVGERMSFQLYDYTARAYDAGLRIVDVNSECGIEGVALYPSLEAALDGLTGTVVCLHKHEAAPGEALETFVHPPQDAVYIVGPDFASYVPPVGSVEVAITTPGPVYLELWSHVVAGMVLYDRAAKAV
jgi:hypothetical protein